MNDMLHQVYIDREHEIQETCQNNLEALEFYSSHVRKDTWKNPDPPVCLRDIKPAPVAISEDFGVSVQTVKLLQCALNGADFCMEDLRETWQFEQFTEDQIRTFTENMRWIWGQSFQKDIIRICQHHYVVRELTPEGLETRQLMHEYNGGQDKLIVADQRQVQFPRAVNFFGKAVPPYATDKTRHGVAWLVNKKYKRAAKQVVLFSPETVLFLFPDLKQWAGKVMYRNIPSCASNPDGLIGFYRMLFQYAAKPERPDLGAVVTVTPPGLRGWLWYWAWKLVRYVP